MKKIFIFCFALMFVMAHVYAAQSSGKTHVKSKGTAVQKQNQTKSDEDVWDLQRVTKTEEANEHAMQPLKAPSKKVKPFSINPNADEHVPDYDYTISPMEDRSLDPFLGE
jgi:type 1 fimbria pilin